MQSPTPSSGAKYRWPMRGFPFLPEPAVPGENLLQPATASAPAADWMIILRREMRETDIEFLRESGSVKRRLRQALRQPWGPVALAAEHLQSGAAGLPAGRGRARSPAGRAECCLCAS